MANLPIAIYESALRVMAVLAIGVMSIWATQPGLAGEPGDEGDGSTVATIIAPSVRHVEVGTGNAVVLRFDHAMDEVLVGDSEVADILPLTDHSIYVLGKEIGSTSLTILDSRRQVVGIVSLLVTVDLLPIKLRLHQQYPDERIEVRSIGRSVMLSGSVSDSAVSSISADIANSYAPDRILNAISIRQPQQVMLAVRVAEIQRSAAQSLGLSVDALFDTGDSTDGFFSDVLNVNSAAQLILGFSEASLTVDVILDALEERGVATVLAEPTLMALSGETASFLAGGEFPVPVGRQRQDDNNVNVEIEFKEFGVRLGFTPTVIGDTINLVVEPEVSELDRQSGIEIEGLVIPGISVRRARTTVELGHGQSFVIAGLISSRFADDIDQVPGLGDIPILGAIGRSVDFRREETELVIIVTPYLVTPSDMAMLRDPTQDYVRPELLESFFLGRTTGFSGHSGMVAAGPGVYANNQHLADSGLDGAVGYVLE